MGLLGLLTLISCSAISTDVVLSSGAVGGYYYRLAEQINSSAKTVGLSVRNLDSQGAAQNLQRLLEHQTDFALVQLDVATKAMQAGQVQAVAILANESIHIIAPADIAVKTFSDLQAKTVALGAPGSGTRFMANQLIQADNLQVKEDPSGFNAAFSKLKNRQVDAVVYVGSLGASESLRSQLALNPTLRLVPLSLSLINYLTTKDPGAYQPATIRLGTYRSRPAIPAADVPTVSTATVLVTRPDVSQKTVGLITWSILSTARQYALFYPELQTDAPEPLLQQGLFYIHPAAQVVYEQGDPRQALARYWENNSDLQAGVFIVTSTSVIGLLLRRWRRQRSLKLVGVTIKRMNELRQLLPHDAQQALKEIEEISQEHRLLFIDGAIATEVYEQLQQKTKIFTDQCRTLLDQQRQQFVLDTLLLLDEWQATLQTDPDVAMQKLGQIKQQYREMLLSNQVDIKAYIELVELTLMSVMTLRPKQTTGEAEAVNAAVQNGE